MSKYLKILVPLLVWVISSLLSVLLKIMHWPGAGILSILKYLICPVIIIYFLFLINERKKFFYPISLAVVLFFFGYLFKIMHWPGAGLLIVGSCTAIVVFYVLRYLAKHGRIWLDHVKLISIIVFCVSVYLFPVSYTHLTLPTTSRV